MDTSILIESRLNLLLERTSTAQRG